MLLYSLLHLTGYGLTLDDLRNFRQLGSRAAGHPERGLAPGIEMTTGPLGQGIATCVGLALGERMLNARLGDELIDHHTFCIAPTVTSRRASAPRRARSRATSGSAG